LSQDTLHDVFDEFTTFIESAGLDSSWDDSSHWAVSTPTEPSFATKTCSQPPQGSATEITDEDSFVELDVRHGYWGVSQSSRSQSPNFLWRVSEADRKILERKAQASVTPSCSPFRIPSRHALTRYFQSYADMFHKHFPVLHLATYSIKDMSPALSLAIAAVGSHYRYEFSNGLELYRIAKDITWDRIRRCPNHSSLPDLVETSTGNNCGNLDHIVTIILLMAYAQWMNETQVLSEALELQGPLVHALRQDGLSESTEASSCHDWQAWVRMESRRRAKLAGFVFLNLQTVFYNTPPLIFCTEVDLLLPSQSAEWTAVTSETWYQYREPNLPSLSFQQALDNLFSDQTEAFSSLPRTSPFALFVLLQGILQKIILARQLQSSGEKTLRTHDIEMLEYVDRDLNLFKALLTTAQISTPAVEERMALRPGLNARPTEYRRLTPIYVDCFPGSGFRPYILRFWAEPPIGDLRSGNHSS
jgi:hypothetical protein